MHLTVTSFLFVIRIAFLHAQPVDAPLTRTQVQQFIKTELAIGQLQKQIRARGGAYGQLEGDEIQVFYEKRALLIVQDGWKLKDFEAVRNRVYEAKSNLEEYEKYKDEQAVQQEIAEEGIYKKQEKQTQEVFREMVSGITENAFLSAEQKKTMLEKIKEMQEQTKGMGAQMQQGEQAYFSLRQQNLTQNQADWPAISPYLDQLQHLSDWYNGKRVDPPDVD